MGPRSILRCGCVTRLRRVGLAALVLAALVLVNGAPLARAQAWASADVVSTHSRGSRTPSMSGDRGWARVVAGAEDQPEAGEISGVRTYLVAGSKSSGETNYASTYSGERNYPVAQDNSVSRRGNSSAGIAATSLFGSYSQGDKDNCGAVALTKLVFALYGEAPAGGAFSHEAQHDGSVSVRLADGRVAYVTAQELRQAARESGMEAGATRADVDAANLLYAVLAVRLGNMLDGRRLAPAAFARALKTLGAGGNAADEDALAPLLGFAFDDHSGDNGAKGIYLLSSALHVAFASGARYDEHGQEGGESTGNFLNSYRDAENHLMFRDFLEGVRADGQPVLVRQCSEATRGWTPGTARWIPRSACAM